MARAEHFQAEAGVAQAQALLAETQGASDAAQLALQALVGAPVPPPPDAAARPEPSPAPSLAQPLPVPEAIAAKCTRDSLQFDPRHGAGQDVFDALVRQVDRIDPSYKN